MVNSGPGFIASPTRHTPKKTEQNTQNCCQNGMTAPTRNFLLQRCQALDGSAVVVCHSCLCLFPSNFSICDNCSFIRVQMILECLGLLVQLVLHATQLAIDLIVMGLHLVLLCLDDLLHLSQPGFDCLNTIPHRVCHAHVCRCSR